MTPRRPANTNSQITVNKWIGTGIMTGIIAVIGFLWRANTQLTQIQERDLNRAEKVLEIDRNVNNVMTDVKAMKERDMQDIKDRLKTLEVQNENKK